VFTFPFANYKDIPYKTQYIAVALFLAGAIYRDHGLKEALTSIESL